MGYLSKDDILKADDLATREVPVPEWGGTVLVRELSGTDRDAFEASLMQFTADNTTAPDLSNMRAKLVARAVVDGDGNLLFNELDIGVLGRKSAIALNRVYEAAAELSGISADAVAVDEANLDAGPPEGSTS